MPSKDKVVVMGGCGHVGLPLAILSATQGNETVIYDIDTRAINEVRSGRISFLENGAEEMLDKVLKSGKLTLSEHPNVIQHANIVVVVVGTPVDEYLNPKVGVIFEALEPCMPYLRDGQVLVLRSTIYPGVSERIQTYLKNAGLDVDVAFCPERVSQGHAIKELQELPQIISSFSPRGLAVCRKFFEAMAPKVIELDPKEAELAKLFTNAYRYIDFAIVNQFYMIAEAENLSYQKIHEAIREQYPRMAKMPGPGLAAGPCLLKDTMQLGAFYHHHFSLGLSALWVNEGLPDFLVDQLKKRFKLKEKVVGILGMAFKADNDDIRDSLSYKLRKLLFLEAKHTLCHDPYVRDPRLDPLDVVLDSSDIIIIGAPHKQYRELQIPPGTHVVDIWNCLPPQVAQIKAEEA
jgi:UDP-N-acetyl-D-mannosaminuronic acid dehydrogenase